MSRNGTGTYTVPNSFSPGGTITASSHNQNYGDIGTEITNSVAADGQTTMTGPLKAANGTFSAPSISFASDPDSGWYRKAANTLALTLEGADRIVFGTATAVFSCAAVFAGAVQVVGVLSASISGLDIIGATQLTAPANNDTLPIYDLSVTANKRILVSDFFKVINDFTADSSPDGAADYVVTYDNSASAAKKVLLANLPSSLPRGYIDGLVLSNGTDTTNDINIAPGKCRDSTDAVDIVISTAMGKQLDANWAAGGTTGSPLGGRNSAAGIANGTYHVWAARTTASAVGDIYIHASATAATVLAALQAESGGSAYAFLRHIGSIVRISGALVQFTQEDDIFRVKTPIQDVDTTTIGTGDTTLTLSSIPTGLRMLVMMNAIMTNASGGFLYLRATSDSSSVPHTTTAPESTLGYGSTGINNLAAQVQIWVDTSAQFVASSNIASTALRASALWWQHPRGKNA